MLIKLLANSWVAIVWAFCMCVYVASSTWIYLRARSQFHEWHSVSVKILESRVHSYNEENGNMVKMPLIRFRYKYNDVEYESNSPLLKPYTIGPSITDYSEIATRYRSGQDAMARLDPASPENCFLELAKFDMKSLILVLALFSAIGAIFYYRVIL